MVYSLCQTTSVESNRMEVGGLHGLLPTTSQKSHNIVTDSKTVGKQKRLELFCNTTYAVLQYYLRPIADVKKIYEIYN